MKIIHLGVAVAVALAAHLAGSALFASDAREARPDESPELKALEQRAARLQTAFEASIAEWDRKSELITPGSASTARPGLDPSAMEAALQAWIAEHPEAIAAAPAHEGAGSGLEDEASLADIPIERLMESLIDARFSAGDAALFQKVRDAGRMDEVLEAFQRYAEEHPDDPVAQVMLGRAYLEKLFGVGMTPEAGVLAAQADAAFDSALAIDDHNWEARFMKAVSLSNWPAFLGKQGEAIEQFTILREQQEQLPNDDRFAQTYLVLGNMHLQVGEKEKALEAWRAGLERFPGNPDLRQQIALNE